MVWDFYATRVACGPCRLPQPPPEGAKASEDAMVYVPYFFPLAKAWRPTGEGLAIVWRLRREADEECNGIAFARAGNIMRWADRGSGVGRESR